MDDSHKGWETVRPDGARHEDDAATGSATGVFGVPVAAEQAAPVRVAPPPLPMPVPVPAPAPVPVVRPAPATAEVVQPVVHRVVVGGDSSGKASDYDELLNRLRAGAGAAGERKTPVASASPVNVAPAIVSPPAVPSSGGFSQLMRTLDVEPAAPVASSAVVSAAQVQEPLVAVPPAEMRKIEVQTIDLRAPLQDAGWDAMLHRPPVEKPPEVVEAKVVQAAEVKLPEPVSPPAPTPAPAEASGFTGMLRTGSHEALDFGRPSAEPTKGSDVPAPSAPAPVPSAPGSFTQMFQALDAKSETMPRASESAFLPVAAAPAIPPPAPPAPVNDSPGSFTQMLRGLEVKPESAPSDLTPVPPEPPAPAPASPGTFTQMFRALDAKVEDAYVAPVASPAPTPVPPVPPPASMPGSFTQMFRALDGKPEDAPSAPSFAPAVVPPTPPSAGAPGTFTQLFRTLDSGGSASAPLAPVARMEPAPVAPPRRDEGSFTQMLSAQRPQDAPSFSAPREPQRAAPIPGAWPPASSGSGGFGDLPPREPERRPEPAGGGLTQLLRALDGPSGAPARRDEAPILPPPAAGPGMFTQMHQRLEDPGQAFAAPQPVQPPPSSAPSFATGATGFNQPAMPMALPPVVGGGQSEFTRILDASRMREMGLRGGGEAPSAPPPAAPVAPPVSPSMPQYAMPPMPQYAAPPVTPPAMPAAPAVQPPQAAAPATGMQRYLPLILIGVIFLLVVIVIALVFVMKH
jgi:hypothetical protein